MKITCASSLAYGAEAFGTLGEVGVLEGRNLNHAALLESTLLAIRSTTRVTPELLTGTAVRFVGTATIGTDHLDMAFLESQGIRWAHAPGSNANSVGEYVTAALLTLASRGWGPLEGRTLGIVGLGNVGRQVARKARALGMHILANDPPRARALARGEAPADPEVEAFVGLDDLLAGADIVTLHVPLTTSGADATVGMAGERFFARMRRGAVFVNAARGPVMDTDALLRALVDGRLAHAVIDTWEGEPRIRRDLLDRTALATPHIAGYSFDGKVNGTVMIYRASCEFLGAAPCWEAADVLPPPPVPRLEVSVAGRSDEAVLYDIVRRVYAIEQDDINLRQGIAHEPDAIGRVFDALRGGYGMRREFPFTQVVVPDAGPALRRKLPALGFQCG